MRLGTAARLPLLLLLIAVCALSSDLLTDQPRAQAEEAGAAPYALVLLSTTDMPSFQEVLDSVRANGGESPQAYPPSALVVTLNSEVEEALRDDPTVERIALGAVDPESVESLGDQGRVAAEIWNSVFVAAPGPAVAAPSPGPPPSWTGPDTLILPPPAAGERRLPAAPTSTQTSEFMAGTIVVSVVFVESSGGSGYCSPADAQTENWDASRRQTALDKISDGLLFWTSRSGGPSPLTFVLDNLGAQPTSCEPINHPGGNIFEGGDEGLWMADTLKALGWSDATPDNYDYKTQALADSRRAYYGADWAYVIFVVDSLNDSDGRFSDGFYSAYAYLNGPLMVLTYDNDGWGIGSMDRVALHETGHIFGALDEYASSGCLPEDTWGYLNAANGSCNNGGNTSDVSVMGEGGELGSPTADVSTSAREAIGWRNPSGTVVDVVRTATVSLSAYSPDPTYDTTPTYSALAGNTPFPPGGCNTIAGYCYRTPVAVTISKVAGAQWGVDTGGLTSRGVAADDGAFDEEAEPYTFTAQAGAGSHVFRTTSVNNFGHSSNPAIDVLTIRSPVGGIAEPPEDAAALSRTSSSWPPASLAFALASAMGAPLLGAVVYFAATRRHRVPQK